MVVKNTSVLLLGRVLSLGLSVVYVAALARYIQATGMGIIATATSLVSIASLIINFGLNDLSTRDIATDKSRDATYVPTTMVIRGLLSVIFLMLLMVVTKWVNYPPEMAAVIFIYAFAYGMDAFTDVCFSVFNAHERMEFSAAIQTGRDIINIALSLAAIALKMNLLVIVGASAFANLVKLAISLGILRRIFVRTPARVNLVLGKNLLLSAFPFAAIALFNVISAQADTFILSLYWFAGEVGWYSSAGLLISYLLLLPTVFFQAIFPVFSKLHASSKADLQKAYAASFKYLLLLGFALCAGTLVTADSIISFIYGPGFERAALALRILGISFFWIFGYANGGLLITTGGQNLVTIFSGIAMGLTTIISVLFIPQWGLLGASLAHILPGALFFMPLIWICHRKLDLQVPYLLSLKAIVASLLMAGAVVVALHYHVHVLITVLVIAPAVYGAALVVLGVLGRQDLDFVLQLFRKRLSRDKSQSIAVN